MRLPAALTVGQSQKGEKTIPKPNREAPFPQITLHLSIPPATLPFAMRVYLDNCCYNRPYDDQSQVRISLEAQAKLHVQDLIRADVLELAASYVLSYENSRNPYPYKRLAINRFVEDNASVYVDATHAEEVGTLAREWLADGLHAPDAHHAACAILAGCDVLLTTDDRFLKHSSPRLTILDPIEFVKRLEATP